nr:hypothetical protein MACL_00001042 [Theileria orientalis]
MELSESESSILESALLDCYGRFITLLPEDVLRDHIHLPFHLQEAFWWYCDKWQVRHPELPSYSFSDFLEFICRDCPILKKFVTTNDLKNMISNWREYAKKIPVRGGIIFNTACEKVLLVQSYKSKSWSFPRGKRDEAEDDAKCAAREIQEETGLDLNSSINGDFYLEIVENDMNLKLFLIPGVDDNVRLKSFSDYEICKFKWIHLRQLENIHYLRFSTFQVKPFIKKIIEFSKDFQGGKYASQFPEAYQRYLKLANINQITFGLASAGSVGVGGSAGGNARLHSSHSVGSAHGSAPGSASGWTPEEMFRVNFEKFGIVSTYKEDEVKQESIFQSWTPVEIRPKNKRYKERELVKFDPDQFSSK